MSTKDRMRKVRSLITRLEHQNVDDFCRQDGRFKSIKTRMALERLIEEWIEQIYEPSEPSGP